MGKDGLQITLLITFSKFLVTYCPLDLIIETRCRTFNPPLSRSQMRDERLTLFLLFFPFPNKLVNQPVYLRYHIPIQAETGSIQI